MEYKSRWLNKSELKAEYPLLTREQFDEVLESLKEKGLIETEDDKVFLTKDAMDLIRYAQMSIDEREKDVM